MTFLRRAVLAVLLLVLLGSTTVAAVYATHQAGLDAGDRALDQPFEPYTSLSPSPTPTPSPGPAAVQTPTPSPTPTPTPAPAPPVTPAPVPPPTPEPAPAPTLQPGPALLADGTTGAEVKDLQARLRQIDWFDHDVTGSYGQITSEAVRGFQAKREIPVTGEVDQRTLDKLSAMTTQPSADELANLLSSGPGNNPGPLAARCRTGRVLCIDKSSRTLRWVVDGAVKTTVDVRFGASATPTRDGTFRVDSKSRDHVSTLYDSAMPFSMFFSRGQAVHYSSDFAARGYAGASHGCVNVRDYDAIAALFERVRVGDTVVVYWS